MQKIPRPPSVPTFPPPERAKSRVLAALAGIAVVCAVYALVANCAAGCVPGSAVGEGKAPPGGYYGVAKCPGSGVTCQEGYVCPQYAGNPCEKAPSDTPIFGAARDAGR